MIVKDLFKKVEFEDLWNVYYELFMKDSSDTELDVYNSKKSHKEAYDKMIDIEPEPDPNKILIFYKYIDELDGPENVEEYNDVCLFYKNEIKENFHIIEEYENDFDFNTLKTREEASEFIKNKLYPIASYAFEFSPWKEILGYEIEEESLNNIGIITSLATVFYEMTFCGFDEEDIEEEVESITSAAEEVEKAIKTGDNSKFVKLEDIFGDLPKISDDDMRISYLFSIENKKRLYKYIKKISNNLNMS